MSAEDTAWAVMIVVSIVLVFTTLYQHGHITFLRCELQWEQGLRNRASDALFRCREKLGAMRLQFDEVNKREEAIRLLLEEKPSEN